jgi:hypothetical protein
MTLATVQDILTGFPGWAEMSLSYGDQTSGQGSGTTIVKNLRDPLWSLHAESVSLSPNNLRKWKAKLAGLDNGRGLFLGYDFASCYPIAYPQGAWPTGVSFSGTTAQVSAKSGTTITLSNLPATFAGNIGDMVSVTASSGSPARRALFQVCEAFTANGSGITGAFEVRPAIPSWVAATNAVAVKTPACHMMLLPGSVNTPRDATAWGVISFDAIQVPTP